MVVVGGLGAKSDTTCGVSNAAPEGLAATRKSHVCSSSSKVILVLCIAPSSFVMLIILLSPSDDNLEVMVLRGGASGLKCHKWGLLVTV